PLRTERPLWDFPGGLYRREVAAYELAVQLGWELVPETVERTDAPLGVGSLQRFVAADFEQHYFTLLEDPRHHAGLRRMALFDVLANNADRKGGHCLVDADGGLWGIDHGLCFHPEPKLRTVIWDWAGERIDDGLLVDVARMVGSGPSDDLSRWLEPDELDALVARAERLLRIGRLPEPEHDRPYPWPLV
ncbi:MAG: SCO1664 family protein, partial [Actinomycetota bacterium]|nr:SCO1664 family protein [Actinomycetota bacterium]